MLDQKFPNRLRYMRVKNGFTQHEVATMIGKADHTMLSRYERGNALPSLTTAAKFEVIYDTHLNDIFPALFSAARVEVESARRSQVTSSAPAV